MGNKRGGQNAIQLYCVKIVYTCIVYNLYTILYNCIVHNHIQIYTCVYTCIQLYTIVYDSVELNKICIVVCNCDNCIQL